MLRGHTSQVHMRRGQKHFKEKKIDLYWLSLRDLGSFGSKGAKEIAFLPVFGLDFWWHDVSHIIMYAI